MIQFKCVPAKVPAVFDMPISMPAYLGAMSIWFTEKPPLAKPARANALVVADMPLATPLACGMNINETAAPTKPVKQRSQMMQIQFNIQLNN